MILMFILGLCIGAAIGVVIMALLNTAKYADMRKEIKEM